MASVGRNSTYVKNIAAVSMCTALIVISSWLTFPFAVNFTLQTFAIFLVCLLFDLKISLSSVILYLLIGIVGIPVFSGFGAGASALLGPTGGFLISFLTFPLIIAALKSKMRILSMLISTVISYIFGTLWYYFIYAGGSDTGMLGILGICVVPFIIPDIIKIFLADALYRRLHKINFIN